MSPDDEEDTVADLVRDLITDEPGGYDAEVLAEARAALEGLGYSPDSRVIHSLDSYAPGVQAERDEWDRAAATAEIDFPPDPHQQERDDVRAEARRDHRP